MVTNESITTDKLIDWINNLDASTSDTSPLNQVPELITSTIEALKSTTALDAFQHDLKDEVHTLLEPKLEIFKDFVDSKIEILGSQSTIKESDMYSTLLWFYTQYSDQINVVIMALAIAVAIKLLRTLTFKLLGDYPAQNEGTYGVDDDIVSTEISMISQIEREYTQNFSVIPMCKPNYNREESLLDQLYENLGVDSGSESFLAGVVTDEASLETTAEEESLENTLSQALLTSQGLKHKTSKQLVFKNSSSVLESPKKSNDKNCSPVINITEETVYSSDFSKSDTLQDSYLR
ncbi:hypothetical protein WICPIJ_004203 [Wickerhamomyces pijperi]|uniref:Uncharacterized protein n=1 Tax=Wickerhamomyces pijperi TaxID=599730 RepID=A0A9P8Q8F1_WICPI|nr:hypothetical protein WICPIJ_004203 [Wickerhamomyces pijperi]